MRVPSVALLLSVIIGTVATAADGQVLFADGPGRPASQSIGLPPGARQLALSPDGSRVAVSSAEGVRIAALDDRPVSFGPPIDVGGIVRSLVWSDYDEPALWVLRHRPAKRRVGDTDLLQIDLERARPLRRLRLPDDAASLTWWPSERALLVAAGPSLRSIRLERMVSGPMFRLSDTPRAAASLGGSRLLVSTADGLALIDLRDAPGPDSMPFRATLETRAPLNALAVSADGKSALGVDESGDLFRILTDPLSVRALDERGMLAVGAPRREVGLRPSRPPRTQLRDAEEPAIDLVTEPIAEPVDLPAERPADRPTAAPAHDGVPEPAAAPPIEPTAVPADAQLAGLILGPAVAEVTAVVVLGPDSMLREAARVAPASDGRWSVSGLSPGRYRVQLSGEAGAVVLSDPPYAVVEVVSGAEPISLPPIRALRRL